MDIKRGMTILAVLIAVAVSMPVLAADEKVTTSLIERGSEIGGHAYTPQCLGDCELVFRANFGASADLTKGVADSYGVKWLDGKGLAADPCIKSYSYKVWANTSTSSRTWVPDVKCVIANNKTTGKDEDNCTDNGYWKDAPGWKMAWMPLKDFKPAEKGKDYYISLSVERKFTGGCANIDAIPVVHGLELKQYAWWNNTWTSQKNYTVINPNEFYNVTETFNVTPAGTMKQDLSDIRVVGEDGTELGFWNETGTPNNTFFFLIPHKDAGANYTVTVYYGNAGATDKSNCAAAWVFCDDFSGTAAGSPPAGWSLTEPAGTSITVVNNLTKFGKAAMIQDGNAGNEPIMTRDLTHLTNFRYLTYVQLQISTLSGDTLYVYLSGNVANMIANKFTDAGFYYYNGGAAWQALTGIGSWSQTDWHRIEIKGSTATDKYNITVNASSQTGIDFRTVGTSVYTPKFQSSDTTIGNEYVGVVAFGNYSGQSQYAWGNEYNYTPTEIILHSNTTNGWIFHTGDYFSTNITAVNGTVITEVASVYISFGGANHTAVMLGNDVWNWNGTLTGVAHGNQTVRQFGINTSGSSYANLSTQFNIQVIGGLNLSAFDTGTGGPITFNVQVSNGTMLYESGGLVSNPYAISPYALPSGESVITFYKANYINRTYSRMLNDTSYAAITALMSYEQNFTAKAKQDGSVISSFSVAFNNGTASSGPFSTTNGRLSIGLDDLTMGNSSVTLAADGYISNTTYMFFGPPNQTNYEIIASYAGLWTYAVKETDLSPVTYNLTISNSTASWTLNNAGAEYIKWTNASIPQGDVTLMFMATDYGPRTYYANVNGNSLTNVTAYLLPLASGSYVRFHVLTVTDTGIQGALVTANRTINGVNILIGSQLTDSSGTALMFLDPLHTYTITASKAGYYPVSSTINPSQSDYTIRLMGGTTGNISTQFSDIWWNFDPSGCGIVNETRGFNFTITSSNSSLIAYGMNITVNGTLMFNGTGTNPAGGSLSTSLNLSPYAGTVISSVLWFNKTGYPMYSYNYDCYIYTNTSSNSSLYGIMMDMGASICPVKINRMGVLWCPPLAMITLIIALFVSSIVAVKFSFNGGGLAAAAVLWIASAVGWWPWQAAFILTCAAVGIVILRGGTGG